MSHKASCSCGQLVLTYSGDITRTSMCHCLECQKRTGSVFGVQTKLEKDKIRIEGQSTLYRRAGDGGSVGTFHFCPTCGSTVYWENNQIPGSVIVAIGAFSEPSLPAPVFSVYRERKHHWVEIPKSVVDDLD